MKKTIFLVVSIVAMLEGVARAQTGNWRGETFATPAFIHKDADGKELNLAAYKGRVVIVNFWATWCAPCIAEMPSLNALAERVGKEKVIVLAVNYHESTEKVKAFRQKHGLGFAFVRDPWQEISKGWDVKMLPTTFVIDRDGKMRYRIAGEIDWASKEVTEKLQPLF
jgi:thiol-disulfide isomerase/thioredoxin